MKKTRILALVLAVVMLMSVLSVTALATSFNVDGFSSELKKNPENFMDYGDHNWDILLNENYTGFIGEVTENKGLTIEAAKELEKRFGDAYNAKDKYLELANGLDFDFKGMHILNNFEAKPGKGSDKIVLGKVPTDPKALEEYMKKFTIPVSFDSPDNIQNMIIIMMQFGEHQHQLAWDAAWSYDANNHWKWCSVCNDMVLLNYHHDVDADGICDECHQPIVYRNITVKDTEGGKVTVSQDKGMVGDRVAVTVTPDAGYKLDQVSVINNNKPHSPRPAFVDVKGSTYHFNLDVWDVEVSATFVKE